MTLAVIGVLTYDYDLHLVGVALVQSAKNVAPRREDLMGGIFAPDELYQTGKVGLVELVADKLGPLGAMRTFIREDRGVKG